MNNFSFANKISLSDQIAVLDISKKLGINPSWLMLVMYFETAGSLSPSKTNHIGSVGLIQFTRDRKGEQFKIVNGVKYEFSALAKMSFETQLRGPVYQYLKSYVGRMKSFIDVYFAVFFPAAMDKPDNHVLQTKSLSASLIAKQNTVFDKNKDLKIERSEVVNYFKNRYPDQWLQVSQNTYFAPVVDKKSSYTFLLISLALFFLYIISNYNLKNK
jgi:hypothetical protein